MAAIKRLEPGITMGLLMNEEGLWRRLLQYEHEGRS